MEWYWWVLIIIAVIALGAFKVWYVPRWLQQQRDKREARERLLEED